MHDGRRGVDFFKKCGLANDCQLRVDAFVACRTQQMFVIRKVLKQLRRACDVKGGVARAAMNTATRPEIGILDGEGEFASVSESI